MLYLYHWVQNSSVYAKCPHVLRAAKDLRGKEPDYEADFCPPFSDAEDELLRKLFAGENFNKVPLRHQHGWMRFPDHLVERLIIGCMACDVELEIINWG